MKIMSIREAKDEFGLMIGTVRFEPVMIKEYGRSLVVVLTAGECREKGRAM